MVRHLRHLDALGVITLVGALVGFVVGAVIGLASASLSEPILLPFAGAGAGIFAGALLVLVPATVRHHRETRLRALGHEHIRSEAHVDWPDGIDLAADPPPRPPRPDRFRP
jgi:hypothetical protein